MFRSLAKNILISGMAYAVISLVGLFLAPFLIAIYGLAGYGQILLARLVLPSSSFAFLDLGIGETTTRMVATANSDGDWPQASRALTLLVAIALVISTVVAFVILLLAWRLPEWLSIAADQRAGFTFLLLATAALQPMLFLTMVSEGTLKGFEGFKQLRFCEIISALAYAAFAIGLGLSGRGPNWIAAGLLASLVIRFVLVTIAAIGLLRAKGVRPTRWSPDVRRDVQHWSRLMLVGKVLGTIQTQVAQPLIGLLIGPAAVGAFDAVVRFPRAAKSMLSLLSGTVFPLATGLKARADTAGLRRLGAYGILVVLLISVPPLIFAMTYSRMLMHYWIGEQVVEFWGWQSAMFVVSILGVSMSFGSAMLLADRVATKTLNRLTMVQVASQILLSLALVGVWDQWAFVLGQFVSTVVVFPLQFVLISRALGLDHRLALQFSAISALSASCAILLHFAVPEPGLPLLIVMAAGFSCCMAPILARLLLTREERTYLADRVRALLAERKQAAARPSEDNI
jgi:O-antigen/teichoic acid export membrane protein